MNFKEFACQQIQKQCQKNMSETKTNSSDEEIMCYSDSSLFSLVIQKRYKKLK